MKSELIKLPYAERDGKLVHISEVDSGLTCGCVCPVCGEEVNVRKGSRTMHHFAHHPGARCKLKVALRQTAKMLLHERLISQLTEGGVQTICWECESCSDTHEVNLLETARVVEIDKDLGPCKPDLTLLDSHAVPVAVIEVVTAHEPEKNLLSFCDREELPLVVFRVMAAADLEAIRQGAVLHPDSVGLCLRPRCSRCGGILSKKVLHVVDADCWKCGSPMKVALLDIDGTVGGPGSFDGDDVERAQELGVVLSEHYSYTAGERCVANTCPSCGAFVGNYYLHNYWDLVTDETGHDARLLCLDCDMPE